MHIATARQSTARIIGAGFFEEHHVEPSRPALQQREPERATAHAERKGPVATVQTFAASQAATASIAPLKDAAASHPMRLLHHDHNGSSPYLSVRVRGAGAALQRALELATAGARAAAHNAVPDWWKPSASPAGPEPARPGGVQVGSVSETLPSGQQQPPRAAPLPGAMTFFSGSARRAEGTSAVSGASRPPPVRPALLAVAANASAPPGPRPTAGALAMLLDLARVQGQDQRRESQRLEALRVRQEEERQRRLEDAMESVRATSGPW